jgi:alpha-D-ribose 1-methylphosphonate 5-triphosphate synthase subunit PhnG
MTKVITREERLALLAAASSDELIDAADSCLAVASAFAVVTPPAVGCVPAQVREPILRQRFFLGDVLACTAEVEFDGVRGWAMRLGDDRAAVLAMAILDAAAVCSPDLAREVDALCEQAADRYALDPGNRELALSLVSSLTSQGVAVLAVFHDLDAIRQLATRVIRLEDGQVVASGTADEILDELEAV